MADLLKKAAKDQRQQDALGLEASSILLWRFIKTHWYNEDDITQRLVGFHTYTFGFGWLQQRNKKSLVWPKLKQLILQDDGVAKKQDDYDAKLQAAIKAAKLNGSARKMGK